MKASRILLMALIIVALVLTACSIANVPQRCNHAQHNWHCPPPHQPTPTPLVTVLNECGRRCVSR